MASCASVTSRTGSFTALPDRPRGNPLSVPALVELAEIFADLVRKTDPLRDPLRHLAVAGQNGNAHLHGLGKAPLDRLGQFRGRRVGEGARDGADDRLGELRLVADVDALKVPAQRDLVAERRRQQVGVGIAADVAKQRLVIDVAARIGRRGPQPRPAASPARRIAARNPANDRWPGRSHRPAPSESRRVEPLVPPFGSVLRNDERRVYPQLRPCGPRTRRFPLAVAKPRFDLAPARLWRMTIPGGKVSSNRPKKLREEI